MKMPSPTIRVRPYKSMGIASARRVITMATSETFQGSEAYLGLEGSKWRHSQLVRREDLGHLSDL
jgi:hypothetical protein